MGEILELRGNQRHAHRNQDENGKEQSGTQGNHAHPQGETGNCPIQGQGDD